MLATGVQDLVAIGGRCEDLPRQISDSPTNQDWKKAAEVEERNPERSFLATPLPARRITKKQWGWRLSVSARVLLPSCAVGVAPWESVLQRQTFS
jgi:hypothetical protein